MQLITDRASKRGLYDTPGYWDMKAESYRGLARSNWPSNTYNAEVHRRQMATLDALLGDVRGLSVADVGCGTGRASLHLAERGAKVTGWDFSAKALEAAAQEASRRGLDVEFRVGDVRRPPTASDLEHFDVVLVLGCLTLACSTQAELEVAVRHVRSLLKPGGRLLVIEPLHSARLTARLLRMGVAPFVRVVERTGLTLIRRRVMFFVPMRYALAFRDLPERWVGRAFTLGERALEALGWPEPLGDYKALLFRAPRER